MDEEIYLSQNQLLLCRREVNKLLIAHVAFFEKKKHLGLQVL